MCDNINSGVTLHSESFLIYSEWIWVLFFCLRSLFCCLPGVKSQSKLVAAHIKVSAHQLVSGFCLLFKGSEIFGQ